MKLEKAKVDEDVKAVSEFEIQKKATEQAQNNILIKNNTVSDSADEQFWQKEKTFKLNMHFVLKKK